MGTVSLDEQLASFKERMQNLRASWLPGPWDEEEDRVVFRHADLDCIISRGGVGAWCGYVAIPKGHPYFGKDYEEIDVDVHGGLTYSESCGGVICHDKPDEDVQWVGFDFCHFMDKYPTLRVIAELNLSTLNRIDDHYWTQQEAINETKRLAEQIRAAA